MFITFEGIDGSGKSTQLDVLEERLIGTGHEVVRLRDPGGTRLSEGVRSLLLDPAMEIAPFAEMLLFSAARTQVVEETIRPALQAGRIVLCDRFFDSTTAYQGSGRGVADPEWLGGFHLRVTGGLVPDRTYLLDISPEEGAIRLGGRGAAGEGADRMERSGMAFFERVVGGYRRLAELEPGRILLLDATEPVDQIHARIWADLHHLMTGRRSKEPDFPAGG